MHHTRTSLGLLAVAMLLTVGACSDDGANSGNDTGGQDQQDTALADTSRDTGQPDTAQPTDTGPADTNGGSDDVTSQLTMPSFTYRRVDESCPTGSCNRGVRVNVGGANTIDKIIPANDLTEDLESADVETIKMKLITDTIVEKMKNGWDCDNPEDPDVRFEFEASVGDGFPKPQKIHDVTGCLEQGSMAADAAKAREIRTLLQGLRDKYFDS